MGAPVSEKFIHLVESLFSYFLKGRSISGDAIQKIEASQLTELVVTDTIPIKMKCDKITVLSTAELFAEVIHRVQNYKSISSLFNTNKS